jgi:hypothetical protein
MHSNGTDADRVSRARRVGLTVCGLAGIVASWNARHDLNPDGLSYLDIAEALQRGHWSAALNGYWNPLYPTLLALFGRPATISPAWEFAAAHLLNLGLYFGALVSFDALLRHLAASSAATSLPVGSWLLIGYAAFLWATVGLIRLDVITPDLFVTMCLSVAFLLFLRAPSREPARARLLLVATGAILGLGYLAKTVMLPVTCLFLLSVSLVRARTPPMRTALPIVAGFLLLAAPYIAAISIDRGRFTVGESGRLNFAWKVGGVTSYFFPRPQEAGRLKHPPRVLCTSPMAFEFGGEMPVTYPPWYDPSYWYEGLTPGFTWRGQLSVLRNSAVTSYVLLRQSWPLAGLLLLMLWSAPAGRRLRLPGPDVLPVLVTCALALVMYTFVELSFRLSAPFIPTLVLALTLVPARSDSPPPWLDAAGALAALVLAIIVVQPVMTRTFDEVSTIKRGAPTHEHLQVATELMNRGLRPGDAIAVIGEGYGAYWARLARARIVAEAPDPDLFWRASPADRQTCIDHFRSTGARILVTFRAHRDDAAPWQPLGTTGYDALRLR